MRQKPALKPHLGLRRAGHWAAAWGRCWVRPGVRSRWFLGDLDALLSVLLHSRTRLNLPPNHPGRLRTLWDFMHLWSRGQYYEVERWSDPRPGMLEARRWLIGG